MRPYGGVSTARISCEHSSVSIDRSKGSTLGAFHGDICPPLHTVRVISVLRLPNKKTAFDCWYTWPTSSIAKTAAAPSRVSP